MPRPEKQRCASTAVKEMIEETRNSAGKKMCTAAVFQEPVESQVINAEDEHALLPKDLHANMSISWSLKETRPKEGSGTCRTHRLDGMRTKKIIKKKVRTAQEKKERKVEPLIHRQHQKSQTTPVYTASQLA